MNQTTVRKRNALSSPLALSRHLQVPISKLEEVISDSSTFYTSFSVPKRYGGSRTITPPNRWLRQLHRQVLDLLVPVFRPLPACVCGGVSGKSTLVHAKNHLGKQLVIAMDVEKFFPSTDTKMVRNALEQRIPDVTASFVADLCTHQGIVPQGSPTSMFMANLCFLPADRLFRRHCRKHNLTYSRYVDDIAVSGNTDFKSHIPHFQDIIKSIGYRVASKKTCYMHRGQRQVVTGLVVNDTLRPTKRYIQGVKQEIWRCIDLTPEFVADERCLTLLRMKNRLTGQMNFIRLCDPEVGKKLKGLLIRLWS